LSFKETRNVIINTLALVASIAWALSVFEYHPFIMWAIFMSLWVYFKPEQEINFKSTLGWIKKQLKDNSF